MYIKIAERLKPFSHLPGTLCMLPGSSFYLQIFPALVRVFRFNHTLFKEFSLTIQGPLKGFTVQCDLEKSEVRVWGESPSGFVRYSLLSQGDDVSLTYAKSKLPTDMSLERLSLGNSKAQDWDLVKRRNDLTEIFPVWHRLGQLIPKQTIPHAYPGSLQLLHQCSQTMEAGHPEFLAPIWKSLFTVGFQGILVPRIWDDQHQGIIPSEGEDKGVSPLVLLSEGSRLIRELFVQNRGPEIAILPALPPEFHCGKLINIIIPGGKLSIEWTKKVIRRMELTMTEDKELLFDFQSNVREFRLKRTKADKGQRVACGNSVVLENNGYYLFDNFK